MKPSRWISTSIGLLAVVCVGAWAATTYASHRTAKISSHETGASVIQKRSSARVMAIGGSAAHGWDDAKGFGGYLARTFVSLSSDTKTPFHFTNESVEGKGPTYYVSRMDGLLKKDKPDMVVISFGLLNDLYDKTPQSTLNSAVKQEIEDALAAHATVVIVTPPITGASYVEFKNTEWGAIEQEIKTAESLKNPNVHIIDLFTPMKKYLAVHKQTWQMYAADGWHPNEAGHKLAATILTHEFLTASWWHSFMYA